jgi:prepilin-type N-terminal cleavage/methylation domain-containing protein
MRSTRGAGFTLIELLTVIAIIAILASMTMVVGPRLIERAKIASLMNVCNQIRTACVGYATKDAAKTRSTFPPAYGYLLPKAPPSGPDIGRFFLTPYLARLGFYANYDMYDSFGRSSYDTDLDGQLSLLEFSPIGTRRGSDLYDFPQELYNGSNLASEVSQQLTAQRPLAYLPVNHDQFVKVETYWRYRVAQIPGRELEGAFARHWNPNETFGSLPANHNDNPLPSLNGKFPPNAYDDFVLISVGPAGSMGGILTPPESFMQDLRTYVPQEHWYYVLALRAFFLATRDMSDNDEKPGLDMDGNGKLDFDFRNRTRGLDGKTSSYVLPEMSFLPDGTAGAGPLIYQCNATGS